ncbi:MAG: tyrosine-type recombinase/integrase [Candidatus Aenigmarchaeota archaeon]|nr:tyrosine-type recombinase/integrase [Candidatus Aenigmarchaeota archaeon]
MSFRLTREYYYTEEELARIFQYLKTHYPIDYYFYKILFLTGRRLNEILGQRFGMNGLLLGDINFEGSFINFQIEKKFRKNKERVRENIKVSDEVIRLIKEYINLVGIKDNREKLFKKSRAYYDKLLRKVLNELGIKKKRILHAFRHSFGIICMKLGTTTEDMLKLQKLMAHSRIEMTMEYAKLKEMQEQELANKIAEKFKES